MLSMDRLESCTFGVKNIINSNRNIESGGEGDSLEENWGMFT